MSKAYYGTRISDNKVMTPEGFLICKNVPVARTGWQDYRGQEIGLDTSDIVQVHRSPEEVFHPATVASFEGKTVTDAHPSEWIQPSNESTYHRGHTQNVRAGNNGDSDLLLADLFIKDSNLINKIQNGLKEVSCGYDCVYEPIGEGRYEQKQIRGNHIAVVHSGRAGDRVAIRDAAICEDDSSKKTKRSKSMNWRHILGLGLKEFAKDAEPEAVANAFEAAKEGEKRMENRNKDDGPPMPEKAPEGGANQMQMLERILAVLEQLVQSDRAVHAAVEPEAPAPAPEAPAPEPEPEDALDQLEVELKGGGHEEPDGDEPVMDSEVIEPVETLPESDRPDNPIPGADSRVALSLLRTMKPIIAKIPNKVDRKKAVDSLTSELRKYAPRVNQGGFDYGKLHVAARSPLSAVRSSDSSDPSDFGQSIKDRYHRKAVAVK